MLTPPKAMVTRFIILGDGTIRECCEEGDSRRPRKRQRSDDDDESEENRGPDVEANVRIRDSEYYSNDPLADCYVHVGQTVFKVHGRLLMTSPTLEAKLARQTPTCRGPLKLYGISPDDFRALLWALYTPDSERGSWKPTTEDDLMRLLDLTNAAKNHEFHTLHAWALSKLQEIFNASGSDLPSTCSSDFFTRLVSVAIQSKAVVPDLLHAATSRWISRIRTKDMPPVPAILCADEHKLRELRGVSYYAHLQQIHETADPAPTGSTAIHLRANPKLSQRQLIQLLAGHLSLVSYWERRRARPRKLECPEWCSDDAHKDCVKVWEERWHAAAGSRKVLALASADVLEILATMREVMGHDEEIVRGVGEACRLGGMRLIDRDISDVTCTLPEHFTGCL